MKLTYHTIHYLADGWIRFVMEHGEYARYVYVIPDGAIGVVLECAA